VNSVAFSPDAKVLAAGGFNHEVWLWSLAQANPSVIARLTGPTNDVNSVAFSPDGKTLAAGSTDSTVWLWNVTDPDHPSPLGQPLTGPTGSVNSVTFTPHGTTIVAGSSDSTTELWSLDVDYAVERICASTSHTMTTERWNQYIEQLTHLPYDPPCAHPSSYGQLEP
jgi:WD40 repeat protein